jgi:putative endonuclease
MQIVYILLSLKDPTKYYIGITRNLKKRLKEHNGATEGYAKRHAPWQVATFVTFNNTRLAENFERYLKQGSGNAFLKKHLI